MWPCKNCVKTLTSIVRGCQALTAVSPPSWPSLALGNGVRPNSSYKSYEKSPLMQKLINKRGAKTKKHWYKPHLGESLEVEPRKKKKGISHAHSVRLRQLSHILYDKVTEIINTGELSQEILDKHVSITAVKMTKDMNNVKVYWEADRDDWQELEHLLSSHSGKLRSLLISYHVLGRIPHIVFVREKSAVNLHQLTELFEKADYGPDHVDDDLDLEQEKNRNITQDGLENLRLHDATDDSSELRTRINCDNLINHFDYNQSSDRVENDHNLKSKRDQRNAIHKDEDCSDDEYFNKGSQTAIDSKYETSTNNDLRYRCDLYGLNREEMMKKILAKKSNSRRSDAKKHEEVNSDDGVIPSLDINPTDFPALVSPILAKMKLQKKIARKERRLHERMLERDSVDF